MSVNLGGGRASAALVSVWIRVRPCGFGARVGTGNRQVYAAVCVWATQYTTLTTGFRHHVRYESELSWSLVTLSVAILSLES